MSVAKVLITVAAVAVALELIALMWLYLSVGSYKAFWVDKAKQEGELTYLALGDSAAQGIGASSPMRGYVGLLAGRLEEATGKKVRVINLSTTGAKIDDVLRDQIPKAKVIDADYVTIEIGANDVKEFDAASFEKQFSELLKLLPKGTYVSNLPLFNSRPNSTKPAKTASKIIERLMRKYPDLRFVDLEKQTTEKQSVFGFAPDLFHPNNLSYKNWADAFWMKTDL